VSHKAAPPETAEQQLMVAFYKARGVDCGWGRDKDGNYFAAFARDAWAAWEYARYGIRGRPVPGSTADMTGAAP
jgi:hypothetical protein